IQVDNYQLFDRLPSRVARKHYLCSGSWRRCDRDLWFPVRPRPATPSKTPRPFVALPGRLPEREQQACVSTAQSTLPQSGKISGCRSSASRSAITERIFASHLTSPLRPRWPAPVLPSLLSIALTEIGPMESHGNC